MVRQRDGRRRLRKRFLLAGAALATGALIACGGDAEEASPAAAPAVRTTPAATPTATPSPGVAQTPAPTPPPTASPSPSPTPTPAPTPASTPVAQLALASSAFAGGATIPTQYTCDGTDISPTTTIANVPAGAVSLALIVDDPDAPGGTWVHWIEFNIAVTPGIPEGVGSIGTAGSNSWGEAGYGGPCPPSGTHRYFFKLYALDADLELPAGAMKQHLEQAMAGHILAQTELMGLYSYSP